jgi:lysophospholipase L1-like esterase
MSIFIFGDSIGEGDWDSMGGWPARLSKMVIDYYKNKGSRFWPTTLNLSVSGDMIRDLNGRLSEEYQRRCWTSQDNLVIIAVGTNDTRSEGQPDFYVNSSENFQYELFTLGQQLRNTTKNVVILGLSDIDETKMNPCEWSDIPNYWERSRVKLFNSKLKQWAESKGYDFVDLYQATSSDPDFITDKLEDGLHPNDAGHELIANVVFEAIKDKYLK